MSNKWHGAIVSIALLSSQACNAAPQSGNGIASPALSPLSAKEIEAGIEAGLGCDFSVGDKPYLVVTVGEAILKADGVVRHFRLDADRSLAIINFGGNFGDRVIRVLIDRDDIGGSAAAEGTVRPARLTVRFATAEHTLTGNWTCGA